MAMNYMGFYMREEAFTTLLKRYNLYSNRQGLSITFPNNIFNLVSADLSNITSQNTLTIGSHQ